ncbi:hypothetical protein CR513_56745, partial [Mucuna pruriens]
MAMGMKSSFSSIWSHKRYGCGDDNVVFTTRSSAENPGKMFRRCPNGKSLCTNNINEFYIVIQL